ncbi:hypothetical protein PY310_06125 [Pseudarthrobacter sp. H3Y2-7]|uniref:hypothetical protein n=1 Tax=Pseudarthrobacter naphthalenicus TaxID=3031328 RepID=UPI0023AE9DDA|nr:hypothetical protein [Pseudarthrobacter sp. H3Y2-7]MDE8668161.1 hypothetical protein [Pseudarthrobacter sp. H3Y2-7]
MESAKTSIIAGIVLMAVGLLFLLDRLGVVDSGVYVPALMFAAVGAVFLAVFFFRRRDQWWAAIPGSVFLGLAAVITASQVAPGSAGGAYLFLFMAAGFAAVYARVPANWWALIPAGVMFTLGVIVALPALQGRAVAGVLFLGLAATFGALSAVPVRTSGHTGTMKWPLIPAAVLGVLGVLFALQATALLVPLEFAVPAVMILAGIGLLVYAYRIRGHGPRTH